ncbi:MAG: glycosyltransferase [Bacteroidota bacterium]
MFFFSIALFAIIGTYIFWQFINLFYWWQIIAPKEEEETNTNWPSVNIIVPARNEAEQLPLLLKDLLKLDYPSDLLTITVVDDFSEDETAEVVKRYPKVKLLQLSDHVKDPASIAAHKKTALTYAISQTDTEIIVTTDADCRWHPKSLKALLASWKEEQFRSGPVLIEEGNRFFAGFQSLDMLSYMFLTGSYAARKNPILANGANLAVSRSLFKQIDGYAGVDHIASGDDVLLLHKLVELGYVEKVQFIPDRGAVVETQAAPSWRAFWRQRLRWAGKTGNYKNSALSWAQGISFLASAALVLGLVLSLFDPRLLTITALAWVFKMGCDGFILNELCRYYDRKEDFRWYLPSALVYPFYLLAIGMAALVGVKSRWKGRNL